MTDALDFVRDQLQNIQTTQSNHSGCLSDIKTDIRKVKACHEAHEVRIKKVEEDVEPLKEAPTFKKSLRVRVKGFTEILTPVGVLVAIAIGIFSIINK